MTMKTQHKIKLSGRSIGIVLAILSNASPKLKEVDFSPWLDDDKEVTADEVNRICEEINFG